MLESVRIIEQYGIEPSKADELLGIDVFQKLIEMRNRKDDRDVLKMDVIDKNLVDYLNKSEVKEMLESNRGDVATIEAGEIGGLDISGGLDLGALTNMADFDIRVLDTSDLPPIDIATDFPDLPDVIEEGADEETPEAPTVIDTTPSKPEDIGKFSLTFEDVEISQFLINYSGNKVPLTDDQGHLVINHGETIWSARYYEDFPRLKTMPVSGEMVQVTVFSKDRQALVDKRMGDKMGMLQEVESIPSTDGYEDASLLFDTQQYIKENTPITLSFNAVTAMLTQIEEEGFSLVPTLSLPHGVAIQSDTTLASLFYIKPKTMYDLANCDEFYQVFVSGNNYMTNYCEANDLEHLRIFEIGGNHLDVPMKNAPDSSIMSKLTSDTAFQERLDKIVSPSLSEFVDLKIVGFAPSVPKQYGYNKIDNLSERAGYLVHVNPINSEIYYIPTVVVNYFEKYYQGVTPVVGGASGSAKYQVIFFMRDDDIEGFYLIDRTRIALGTPSKIYPLEADKRTKMLRSKFGAEFANKIDLVEYLATEVEFLGEVREQILDVERKADDEATSTTEEVDETQAAIDDLKRQKAEFEQGIDLMDASEDADLIAEMQTHIAIINDTLKELGEVVGESDGEKAIVEAMEETPETDELAEMAEGNDQEFLPIPTVDNEVVGDIIEMEGMASDLDMNLDLNLGEMQVEEVEDEEDAREGDDVEDVLIDEMPDIPEGTEIYGYPEVEDDEEDDEEEEDALFRGVNKEKIENFIEDMAESNWEDFEKLKDEMDESPESSEDDEELDDDDFAKGGKTKPTDIRGIVDAMTDDDVASKIVDILYNDLGYGDYEQTEGEAYQEALRNIEDSRKALMEIMEEEAFAKGGKTKAVSSKKLMKALRESFGGPYTILRWHPTLNELEYQVSVDYPQETWLELNHLIEQNPDRNFEIEDNSGIIVFRHKGKKTRHV